MRYRLETGAAIPTLEHQILALREFGSWLVTNTNVRDPEDLARIHCSEFAAHVRRHKNASLGLNVSAFLDMVHVAEWEPRIKTSARFFRREFGKKSPRPAPRFLDEPVIQAIEEAVWRIDDPTFQTLTRLVVETGVRIKSARMAPIDCLYHDEANAPYLRYWNPKALRWAYLPITDALESDISAQRDRVLEEFPESVWLFPCSGPGYNGTEIVSYNFCSTRLRKWIRSLDLVENGKAAKVTWHRFRHTLATRMAEHDMPFGVIQQWLDHDSPQMTAIYASIKDQKLRQEWEEFRRRVKADGEVIDLGSDAEAVAGVFLKDRIARAKQALPNGYCGRPLREECPHPNACLSCDHFLTGPEFLPILEEQRTNTRKLIATATDAGQFRMVEMNTRDLTHLDRIIEACERDDSVEREADAPSPGASA